MRQRPTKNWKKYFQQVCAKGWGYLITLIFRIRHKYSCKNILIRLVLYWLSVKNYLILGNVLTLYVFMGVSIVCNLFKIMTEILQILPLHFSPKIVSYLVCWTNNCVQLSLSLSLFDWDIWRKTFKWDVSSLVYRTKLSKREPLPYSHSIQSTFYNFNTTLQNQPQVVGEPGLL